jgi:hypothetical protein
MQLLFIPVAIFVVCSNSIFVHWIHGAVKPPVRPVLAGAIRKRANHGGAATA